MHLRKAPQTYGTFTTKAREKALGKGLYRAEQPVKKRRSSCYIKRMTGKAFTKIWMMDDVLPVLLQKPELDSKRTPNTGCHVQQKDFSSIPLVRVKASVNCEHNEEVDACAANGYPYNDDCIDNPRQSGSCEKET